MKLLEVLTPQPGIYHDCYNHNTFLEDNLKPVNMKKMVEGKVLGNIMISRMASSIPSWTYFIILIVRKIEKPPLQNQGIIQEDQVRV